MTKLSIRKIRIISIVVLSLLLLIALLTIVGCGDLSGLALAVSFPVTGGSIVTGEPLTTKLANESSPSLLQNEIDDRITKIRPMSTPIDQISRYKGARKANSMVVDYYSVDTKPSQFTIATTYTEPTASNVTANHMRASLEFNDYDALEASDTLMAIDINGYEDNGTKESAQKLILYVVSKNIDSGEILVVPINGKNINGVKNCVPTIAEGSQFVRMGRAATELDVQTAQFEALPIKSQNFCQIFKMQIEQSTFFKIANKEVEWDFSDQEEVAIYDMRMSMEKSYLFGVKNTIYDPVKKEDVSLTGGIWWQAGKEYQYDTAEDFSHSMLVDIMQQSFTGNAGNKRKILIAGSDLISNLSKMEFYRTISNDNEMMKWGLDFNEITTKFGKLYVMHSEIFDECGMSSNGLIFDPEYIQKWSHVPFGSQSLDLKKAGIRNTDALVLTEASCMTLRYPNAHMRIVGY